MRSIPVIAAELEALLRSLEPGHLTRAQGESVKRLRGELNTAGNEPLDQRSAPRRSRSAGKTTFCHRCKTYGTPETRCKCPPKQRAAGLAVYDLVPAGQAARSAPPRRTLAETRARAHAVLDRAALEDGERLVALPYGAIRDQALRTIEKRSTDLSPASQDKLDRLVRTRDKSTDGRLISRRIAAAGSDAYRTAFQKAMTSKNPAFTPEEVRAVNTYYEVRHEEMRAANESSNAPVGKAGRSSHGSRRLSTHAQQFGRDRQRLNTQRTRVRWRATVRLFGDAQSPGVAAS
jgi:hypothetical protein